MVKKLNSTTAEEVARLQLLFPNQNWFTSGNHLATKTLFQYSQE